MAGKSKGSEKPPKAITVKVDGKDVTMTPLMQIRKFGSKSDEERKKVINDALPTASEPEKTAAFAYYLSKQPASSKVKRLCHLRH